MAIVKSCKSQTFVENCVFMVLGRMLPIKPVFWITSHAEVTKFLTILVLSAAPYDVVCVVNCKGKL